MKYGNNTKRHRLSGITLVLLSALAILGACTGEQPAETVQVLDPDTVFTAAFDQDGSEGATTRTYVDGSGETLKMHWTAGDAVSIFFSTYGEEYIFQGETGDRGGAFAKAPASGTFTGAFQTSRYYSVDPYAESTTVDESGVIHFTFPDTQAYAEGSFGLGASPMVAATASRNDYHLTFKNVCSFVRLQIYGGATIAQIRFSGNANETLCGTADITTGFDTLPQTVMTGEGKTLTLNCGGVTTSTDSQAPTSFWLAIPPTTFASGFTVEVTDDKGNVTTQASSKSYVFARNEVTPMRAFEVQPQTPPEPPTPEIPDLPEVNNGLPVLYVYLPGFEPADATTTDLTNTQGIGKENWITDSHAYLKDTDGTVTDLGTASIRGRGNTTWDYKKKPYAFKLDKKASLLGMPKDKRWDLLANYLDRTRMRNDLALELGRRLGPDYGRNYLDWTPHGKFVELVLNNVFLGNYYLVEHIKIAKDRVNIKEMKSTDVDEETITGGYLMECGIEMDEVNQFWTNFFTDVYPYNRHGKENGKYHIPVMVKDPDADVMVPAQLTWLENYINGVQGSIIANNGNWRSEVDMDSFICWMFIQEIVSNYEPFHPKSAYMHKDRGGKLMMGPLWDFDYGTFDEGNGMTPIYHYAMWYPYMLKDATFTARVKELWPIVQPILSQVCSDYAYKYTQANATPEVMSLMVSIDKDWARWKNLGGQPTVNGDEDKGIWVAFKRMTDNLAGRISQMTGEVNNNM